MPGEREVPEGWPLSEDEVAANERGARNAKFGSSRNGINRAAAEFLSISAPTSHVFFDIYDLSIENSGFKLLRRLVTLGQQCLLFLT